MSKFFLFLFFEIFTFYSFAQTEEYSIRDLKNGKFKEDQSFVYSLPFEKRKSYLLIQAYQSNLSHKGEYALDLKMKEGTKICASRGGVVISLREDSDKGGLKPEMLSEGNYIVIQHDDGSLGNYWHLQFNGALVNIGDTVQQTQIIGLSGNIGYSAFPHLHFEVSLPEKDKCLQGFKQVKK